MEAGVDAAQARRASPRLGMKPLGATVDEACRIGGFGRNNGLRADQAGQAESVAIGRQRLVLFKSLEVLLARTPETRDPRAPGAGAAEALVSLGSEDRAHTTDAGRPIKHAVATAFDRTADLLSSQDRRAERLAHHAAVMRIEAAR